MSLVNGDLFDEPDPESEAESGWVGGEPWPGRDQAALDAEWCEIDGPIRTPEWVDQAIDDILGDG